MDERDIRIFCALAITGPPEPVPTGPVRGLGALARDLGLDEKTVRVRLRRLEGEGFIKYYQAAPNLSLLGEGAELTCRFESINVATKLEGLAFARQQTGMVEALDFLGTTFAVTVAAADEAAAAAVQQRIARHAELTRFEQGTRLLPRPDVPVSALDWRIIERLRYDGHAPAEEVSRTLGITPRMVRYRLSKLVRGHAVEIRPVIDARKQTGVVLFRLAVRTEERSRSEVLARLRRTFGERVWAARLSLAGPILLDLFGFSLADSEDAAVRALAVPGVHSCTSLVLKEVVEPDHPSWVDRRIAELAVRSDRVPRR